MRIKQVKVHVLDHMDAIIHAWKENGYKLISSNPIESSKTSIGYKYFMFIFQKESSGEIQ